MSDQMITIKGVYENGKISVSSPYQPKGKFAVLITFLEPINEISPSFIEKDPARVPEFLIREMNISQRDLDILILVVNGARNPEIAKRYELSAGTVRNYISGLLRKFEVKTRAELIISAVDLGIVKKE